MDNFVSVLFRDKEAFERYGHELHEAPSCFHDLQLDRVVDALLKGREDYGLKTYYYRPLADPDLVLYRQEVMSEVEGKLYAPLQQFSAEMLRVRKYILRFLKFYYKYQQERWLLEAVMVYCQAVVDLHAALTKVSLHSRGFRALAGYLADYRVSAYFVTLQSQAQHLHAALASIRYCVHIDGLYVEVSHAHDEPDYSKLVEAEFSRFQETVGKSYLLTFPETDEMNHIEARILEGVAWLHADLFAGLDTFCEQYFDFQDKTIGFFDREIQFYLTYADYMRGLKEMGYQFCMPGVSRTAKESCACDTFDLALATLRRTEQEMVVVNDFSLTGHERILVVTGPNQGGKTTFARTFGQVHYLASLGLPVPGTEAVLWLPDRIYTHFGREENSSSQHGNLQDDLLRMYDILCQATGDSIVILNELFQSTTLYDQLFLSREIMRAIVARDIAGVWVTFLGELSAFSEQTVSMVSSIVPENPALRTYKIIRHPADDLVYALSIAEKYNLRYQSLIQRLA